jgi:hypothetical protein
MNRTRHYSALWTVVEEAARYRSALARRVSPWTLRPYDALAVRFADVTTKEGTVKRLKVAKKPKRKPNANVPDSALHKAALRSNFAEAVAELFFAQTQVSPREVEEIKRIGAIQESIAESFYAPLRFGRFAAVALGVAGVLALPKEPVEDYFDVSYAKFAVFVFGLTLFVLVLLGLISWRPGRLAARRARNTRLFKGVLVYLEFLAAEAEAIGATTTTDPGTKDRARSRLRRWISLS